VIRELPGGAVSSPAAQAPVGRTTLRPAACNPATPQPETAPPRPTALQTKVRIIIITGNANPNNR